MTHPMTQLTSEMIELILPMLGFSIVLNVVLLLMLLMRPVYRRITNALYAYWLGMRLLRRNQ